MAMIDKLNVIFQRYNEVNDLIIQPDVISDSKRWRERFLRVRGRDRQNAPIDGVCPQ